VLRFGTDGVRGVAGRELTAELVLALGRAAARALDPRRPFVVARDTRRSGPMIEAALVAGFCAEGADVELLGVLPTPGLAAACAASGAPGAMISASHNPFPDNGVKFFEPGGRKLRDATEERIEAELAVLLAEARPGAEGRSVGAVVVRPDALDAYVDRLVTVIDRDADAGSAAAPRGGPLGGLHVVVDCGNGAASEAAPRALRALGARVTVMSADPDGCNINDGCGSTDTGPLQARVPAEGADAGLAFDGDADRVVAVDESGTVVDGDHILAVAALDLAARGRLRHGAVATTVMANLGLRRALGEHGIRVVETPVGDRHVLAAMEEHDLVLGGEQSGHVIFAEHAVTGDGPLTGILLLDAVVRSGRPLSKLASVMTRYPQVLRNVAVASRDGLDAADAFWSEVREVESDLGDAGRVLVRPSGTEPVVRVMVEAGDEARAAACADRLADALVEALGGASAAG